MEGYDEIAALAEELGMNDPNWFPDDWEEQLKINRQEIDDEWFSRVVFDAGSGKRMTLGQFEKFYETDKFSKELVQAASEKTLYSKETAGEIKCRYGKIIGATSNMITEHHAIRPQPAENVEQRVEDHKPKEGQFLKVQYGFMEKVKEHGVHQNPTSLLMLLLTHRSWKGKMDKHHTYTHWFTKKNRIVASRSVEQLAQDMGVSEKTIRRWLKELKSNGDIDIVRGSGAGYKRENIYILGEVGDDKNERLYYLHQA